MDALDEIRRQIQAIQAAGGQAEEIQVGEGARGALLDSLAFCGVGYGMPDRLFGLPVRQVTGERIQVTAQDDRGQSRRTFDETGRNAPGRGTPPAGRMA